MEDWSKNLIEAIETVALAVDEFFTELNEVVDTMTEELQQVVTIEIDQRLQEIFEPIADLYLELEQLAGNGDLGFTYTVEPNAQSHPACIGCNHYHGQIYSGNLLVCGMHPYGWETQHCPDWEGSEPRWSPVISKKNTMASSTLDESEKEPENFEPLGKKKRSPLPLIIISLLLTTAGAAFWYLSNINKPSPIRLSGRIEGYETDVGTKVAGRIISVSVREGEEVTEGQLLVKLDDAETNAQLQGATARLNASQQMELQAQLQISLLENQIREAELGAQQSQGDTSGRVLQAESTLASVEAQLTQAQAQQQQAASELSLAQKNLDRFSRLLGQGVITQQQYDQVQTSVETTQANLESRQAVVVSFQRLVNASQGQVTQARTTELNPEINNLQIQNLRTQLAQTRLKLAAAGADVSSARAAQEETKARVANQSIFSPLKGVVMTRNVEPGTVVTPGKNLLTVINPQQLYLRGYIPEADIARVRLGQDVRIFLDSRPNQPLLGKVTAIDPQASFTPENIYFKEDRVRQVFGLRVSLDNLEGLAKPGMPADAEIVLEGDKWKK